MKIIDYILFLQDNRHFILRELKKTHKYRMAEILEQEIKYLPGVGPQRAEMLKNELDIHTFEDLLYYFPYRYIDRSKFYTIKDIHPDLAYIQVIGKIISFRTEGPPRKKRLIATFADQTGTLELLWFKGHKWIKESLKPGIPYVVYGKPGVFNRKINIIHPEIEEKEKFEQKFNTKFQALYNTTDKLKNSYVNTRVIQKLQNNLFQKIHDKIEETLPSYLVKKLKLMPLKEALLNIHFPASFELLEKAQYRLKFEELFYIQLNIVKQKNKQKAVFDGFKFPEVGTHFNAFYNNNLPFELTNAQKRVLKEIRKDLNSGKQMNRLLQGDVGSGKTMVALMSILIGLDNNFQASVMAPTEILANQHYDTIVKFLNNLDINTRLLTGSTKQSERKTILDELKNGKIDILIGTHALLEEPVQFKHLGIVIIDEQHRFGVAQRAKLWKKNTQPPHVLVMTATPIPRTLAMTVYGDLDVSVIDELPPGRKPVKTSHLNDAKRLKLFGFMRDQIKQGRQIFVVYPLIKESEKMDYKNLEDGYASVKEAFPPPDYTVSIVHGKMKTNEKNMSMQLFISGKAQILVATTVIEVGVDIPNASVMVIESAERFGLSQLHQLRGRVGRGADQSYCILMTGNKLSEYARKRIQTMVQTNNGFDIAEADLQLRGPGDIEGTQQSGIPFNFKIANLAKDGMILQQARNVAVRILDHDPDLNNPNNKLLVDGLKKIKKSKTDWSVIS